jgi:hypothetical protein
VLALGSCNDEAMQPTQVATLRVVLTTPNSGRDGAAVVILTSPATPVAVHPGSGLTLWGDIHTPVDTIALTGLLFAGTILTVEVRDPDLVSQYRATLREVAAGDGSVALRDLTGYTLTVTR